LLAAIQKGNLQGLKFLVTSREDDNVASLCQGFSSDVVCRLHKVAEEDIHADILRYLDAELPLLDEPECADLARRAGGLFIYAATAVRYMTPQDGLTKEEQVDLMGSLLSNSIGSESLDPIEDADEPLQIDILYRQILSEALGKLKKELRLARLRILHTFLCTEEHVSMSVAAGLLSASVGMIEQAKQVVSGLHAVLYIKDGKVFWYHASFPDFIFTQARSKFAISTSSSSTSTSVIDMSCSPASHHAFLTHSCFRIMMTGPSCLCFNICNLPSSFLLDSEVPNLKVEENICDVLQYACRYWAQHMIQAISSEYMDLQAKIADFLQVHVLFWIEAMNLLHLSSHCTAMLQQVQTCILKARKLYLSNTPTNIIN